LVLSFRGTQGVRSWGVKDKWVAHFIKERGTGRRGEWEDSVILQHFRCGEGEREFRKVSKKEKEKWGELGMGH